MQTKQIQEKENGFGKMFGGFGGFLSAPGRKIREWTGTAPGSTETEFIYPEADNYFEPELQAERDRLDAIASGTLSTPEEIRAAREAQSSLNLVRGLAMAAPSTTGAGAGRLARGAVAGLGAQQQQGLAALRAHGQESARLRGLAMSAQEDALSRQQHEDIQNQLLQQRIAEREELERNRDQWRAATSTAIQAGASLQESDKRSKKNIKPGGKDIEQLLSALAAKTFEMRDGGGPQVGIIAQDLKKGGPLGKQLLGKNEEGVLGIKIDSSPGPILAALAHLNEKIDKLSEKKS
jgi:hypothetical protein